MVQSMPDRRKDNRRIGFVSTRLASNDGVSLETEKWVHVLEGMGYECFFFAGECEWPQEKSRVVPEAHFKHPGIQEIHQVAFSNRTRPLELSQRIHKIKDYLKMEINSFVQEFDVELLITENSLTIPMNVPLGVALTEFIAETGFPTIAHHHDFFWERQRFLVNCVWDYLNMAFPPHLPSIQHVVINSSGANQLSLRTGISSRLIPNVMDFAHPPDPPDDYTRDLRQEIGVVEGQYFFLQPTRVVQRKGIEHAIELIARLESDARLVISHASEDEGDQYEQRVRQFAQFLDVPVNFISDIIKERRGRTEDGRKIYTLWDVYPYADLVTYPSTIEGFGNAFLEAIYFCRPILVNNYSIFDMDIKPKGFRVIEFDGYITDECIQKVERVLSDSQLMQEMTERNYRIARRHYSYAVLERHLHALLTEVFGHPG
jgi:glycosyltransferase involved in cell wall biosynthesis